ncbi:MAG: DUF2344 domain-containing protein [Dehalococcoidia bacterium]|nr:DUF2344 domain-containing protein [Dehalococcoidia bacterium]
MAQRLRVTYRKDGPATYVAHLDVMRTWERTIRRAGLPLAYSQGFSPHPRLALAAPLPVGIIGERELLDLFLEQAVAPAEARELLVAASPPGFAVVDVDEVGERLPSLQSVVRAARYEVAFAAGTVDAASLRARVDALLGLAALDWEEARGEGEQTRRYDLRAAVLGLAVRERGETLVLEMHLSLEEGRTGRPVSVLAALGVTAEPARIARTAVEVERTRVALRAWRERGRFER